MGWIRVSDDFYDHPKFADVTPLSIALWIVGMGYCNRNLTDGHIPTSVAARLCDFDGLAYTVAEAELCASMEDDCAPLAVHHLLESGLWHEQGHDCAECPQPGRRRYYVHGYLDYQPSAEEIQAKKESLSERGKKGAQSRWNGHRHGSGHSRSNGQTDGQPNGQSMPPTPTPTPLLSTDSKETSSRKRSDATPNRFDEFWEVYDRKVERKKAEQKYRLALKKSGVTDDLLIAAAREYVTWERANNEGGRYIKHPTTWLNGECWNDERAARQQPMTRPQQHLAIAQQLATEANPAIGELA